MFSDPDFASVMGRLRDACGVATDAGLAEMLGLKRTAFSNRKKDGSIPWEDVIRLAKSESVDLDWLIWGVGKTQEAQPASRDGRLTMIVEWLCAWWDRASPEERIWAEIQMGRAFPEYLEFVAARAAEPKQQP
jgi:hypothetical protein